MDFRCSHKCSCVNLYALLKVDRDSVLLLHGGRVCSNVYMCVYMRMRLKVQSKFQFLCIPLTHMLLELDEGAETLE